MHFSAAIDRAVICGAITTEEILLLGQKIEPIAPTMEFPHKDGSLFQHLMGTWRALCANNAPESSQVAGLIHSIYATQFYKTALFHNEKRSEIANLYGERAEKLAYLFSSADRKMIWSQRHNDAFPDETLVDFFESDYSEVIDADYAKQLLQIECCNYMDQCCVSRKGESFLRWAISLQEKNVGLKNDGLDSFKNFTEADEVQSAELYRLLTSAELLSHELAVEIEALNPVAAEPKLFLALSCMARADFQSARQKLTDARELLTVWGTSWDKRLAFHTWVRCVDALFGMCRDEKLPEQIYNSVKPDILAAELLRS